MAEMYAVKGSDLTDIADAIRLKTDSSAPIEIPEMANMIRLIEGGGAGGNCELAFYDKTVEVLGDLFDPTSVTPTTTAKNIIPAASSTSISLPTPIYLKDSACMTFCYKNVRIAYKDGADHFPRTLGSTNASLVATGQQTQILEAFETAASAKSNNNFMIDTRYLVETSAGVISAVTGQTGVYDVQNAISAYISSNSLDTMNNVSSITNYKRLAIGARLTTNFTAEAWNDIDWGRSTYNSWLYVFKMPYEIARRNPIFWGLCHTGFALRANPDHYDFEKIINGKFEEE